MDNGELSSLDFCFIARELDAKLKGGVFRKVYQTGRKRLAFEIYVPSSGECVLYADGKRMFIASGRGEAPEEPPNFCMLLRKHLTGRKIQEVRQHGFDRVVEVETSENILIFEFLPPGNAILCDKYYNIIMPLEVQKWKHREVKPRGSYSFPPEQKDMRKLEIWDFFTEVSGSDKDTAEALASMGLGKLYAREACVRAGISIGKPAARLTVDEATELFNAIMGMVNSQVQARSYRNFVTPFTLQSVPEPSKPMRDFSEALDGFFTAEIAREDEKAEEEIQKEIEEKEAERVEKIEKARGEAKEALSVKREEKSTKAQLIYRNYDVVSSILSGLKSAREKGVSWQLIKEKLLIDSSKEAKAVKAVKENEGIIVVELDGTDVELDLRKTAEENAGGLFDTAKKIGRKLDRLESLPVPKPMSVEEIQYSLTGKKLKPARKRKQAKQDESALTASDTPETTGKKPGKPKAPKTQKTPKEKKAAKPKGKRWYETYRWFISSEGNVVAAGKNALQNESLVKNRAKEGDAVFHADIHGAAFVLAKPDEKGKIGPLTIKEAAEFAAAYSKAWNAGFSAVDVLQFRPGDLKKTSPDGAKLPRGSFYALPSGRHEKIDVKLSIGVKLDAGLESRATIVAGPLMPVRKSCKYFATIQPGSVEGSQLAQRVKNAILAKCMPEHRRAVESLLIDDFSRHIPGGAGSIVN